MDKRFDVVRKVFTVSGGETTLSPNYRLRRAAADGDADQVRALLAGGAEVDSVDVEKRTALSLASEAGHSSVVEELLRARAQVDLRDGHGNTALHLASKRAHIEVAERLIEAGADIEARDPDGHRPLMMACFGMSPEMVKWLLAKGAYPWVKNVAGKTPLRIASRIGDEETVQILLAAGVDVDEPDAKLMTPLMYAAENGEEEVVRCLLDAGADPRRVNKQGWSASLLARANDNSSLASFLEERGSPAKPVALPTVCPVAVEPDGDAPDSFFYALFNPYLTSSDRLEFDIGRNDAPDLNAGTASLIAACLASLRLDVGFKDWAVRPVRCAYYSDYRGTGEDWRDRWRKCWAVEVQLDRHLQGLSNVLPRSYWVCNEVPVENTEPSPEEASSVLIMSTHVGRVRESFARELEVLGKRLAHSVRLVRRSWESGLSQIRLFLPALLPDQMEACEKLVSLCEENAGVIDWRGVDQFDLRLG
jgi:hypothetical protein